MKQRSIRCVEVRTNRAVRDIDCESKKPKRQQECFLRRCTEWSVEPWSSVGCQCIELNNNEEVRLISYSDHTPLQATMDACSCIC